MTDDRIERDTLIAAPLERVWDLVARPGWWAADGEHETGTMAVPGESTVARHSEYGDFPIRVESVEPQTYVAYRWASAFPGEEVRAENSTLVEFTLTAEGDQTRLRVVESGFGSLPTTEENRQRAVSDNTGGWGECLEFARKRTEHALK
ncbi:SRPBCC domain-containing protein [Solicola gregarius]|uniref:SRPBCC domain-containing protein n=1 Tax=Solicola gregarius TaxID=2908642 RepID=A0AA46TIE7_9ACTN|nr:SRPBCC domain-containing protein [Solicola gregarius]UYM05093.1 SRPBCC domain-containing protein [Solicola gregarius]